MLPDAAVDELRVERRDVEQRFDRAERDQVVDVDFLACGLRTASSPRASADAFSVYCAVDASDSRIRRAIFSRTFEMRRPDWYRLRQILFEHPARPAPIR